MRLFLFSSHHHFHEILSQTVESLQLRDRRTLFSALLDLNGATKSEHRLLAEKWKFDIFLRKDSSCVYQRITQSCLGLMLGGVLQ